LTLVALKRYSQTEKQSLFAEVPLKSFDYRKLLEDELGRRQSKNPRYSLRAFARDLSISPSLLCSVFSKQHGLSEAKAQDIAKILKLPTPTKKLFLASVLSLHARSEKTRKNSSSRLNKLASVALRAKQIELDAFEVISDWYHLALLEYLTDKKNPTDSKELANKFGLKTSEVNSAIERLLNLGLLQKVGLHFVPVDKNNSTPDDIPSVAIRSYHRQILGKAMQAVDEQGVHEREFSSVTLRFQKHKIARAQELIRDFQQRFSEEFKVEGSPSRESDSESDIMCLAVQFFSLLARQNPSDENSH
jgi:uncharacterized protein (TIGR02147 family)